MAGTTTLVSLLWLRIKWTQPQNRPRLKFFFVIIFCDFYRNFEVWRKWLCSGFLSGNGKGLVSLCLHCVLYVFVQLSKPLPLFAGLLGSLPGLLWFLYPWFSEFAMPEHTPAVPGGNLCHSPPQSHPGGSQVCFKTATRFHQTSSLKSSSSSLSLSDRTIVGYKHTWMLGKRYSMNVTYKIFCGWDFTIQDPDSATLKQGFIRNDLKVNEGTEAPWIVTGNLP